MNAKMCAIISTVCFVCAAILAMIGLWAYALVDDFTEKEGTAAHRSNYGF